MAKLSKLLTDEQKEKLLAKDGWEVECWSPFEIRSKFDSQSYASGEAASMIVDYIRQAKTKKKKSA